jgi:hypothetical protein
MPTLYDSNNNYNSTESYDFQISQRMLRRDLFAFRGTDAVFNCQAVDVNNQPIDLSDYEVSCQILEYENGITVYPAVASKVIPDAGMFQILIDDTTKLDRPRYVYHVFAVNGLTKIKLQQGQLLVE